MRALVFLAAAAPVLAFSQASIGGGVAAAARQAVKHSGIDPRQPLQGGTLPKPDAKVPNQYQLINADDSEMRDGLLTASGNVHFTYRGYVIKADQLIGNFHTNRFQLKGNGSLKGESEDVKGEFIEIDMDDNSFIFRDGTARLSPERLEKKVAGDVFIQSKDGLGQPGHFYINGGTITTCEYEDPHYQFDVGKSDIIPGRRAKLRNVKLKVLGRTVFRVPYLVVPLTPNAEKYLPEVGQTPDEGYYVKFKFSVPFKRENYMDVRVDLFEKLGLGLGGDANFFDPRTKGRVTGYWLLGPQPSQRYTADLEQKLGRGTFTINSSYQVDDYLTAVGSTIWNLRSQYVLPWGDGTTRFSAFRSATQRTGFSTVNQIYSVSDNRTYGKSSALTTRIDANYSINESNGITLTKSERVDVRFQATKEFKSVTADLLYQRSIPVGNSTNFYNSSDRTPLFTLRSDTDRIFGKDSPNSKIRVEGSVGELIDPATKESVTRFFFDAASGDTHKIARDLNFTWNGRFRQGMYSDDTAQYSVNYDGRLSWAFAPQSSVNINYRRIKAVGYTPLSIDRTGQADAFTLDYTHRVSRSLTLTAYTGYDVLLGSKGSTPWQQVSLNANWLPNDRLRVQTNAVYDTFAKLWSTFRADIACRWGNTLVTATARYDGRRQEFAGGNLTVQALKFGRLTTNFLLDFNGYTKQFDAAHFQFVYDLHCAEAVFEIIENNVGFRSGRQLNFFIRIKALPGGGFFGTGTRGQAIGSGSGFGF